MLSYVKYKTISNDWGIDSGLQSYVKRDHFHHDEAMTKLSCRLDPI